MDGFWGPPTASMDWCEANYVHLPIVAEFWNTLSSSAIVIAGAWGLWTQWGKVERRFLIAFGLLMLVGLGSIAFHGTLLRELQLFDQLPMWYLVVLITWILTPLDPTRAPSRALSAALIVLTLVVTAATVMARGQAQFLLFHTSFASLEIYSLARVAYLQRSSREPALKRLFRWAFAGYALSVAVWFADLKECTFLTTGIARWGLPRIEWHAVWHLGISLAFTGMLLVIAGLRRELRSATPL